MDIIVIFNGLGNQMSQYAFYLKKKAINSNSEFITFCNDHNGLELDRIFNINCRNNYKKKVLYVIFRILLTEKFKIFTYPVKAVLYFFGCKIIRENFKYNFNPEFLKSKRGINFYFGGWHSELYFKSETDQITKEFYFGSSDLSRLNLMTLNLINSTNSVSFHVRRGDFLNKGNVELFGNICTLDYFKKAKTEIEKRISTPHYFIFSNDMEWVKLNIILENVTYVEGNESQNSWIDLYLMSKCKNHIIANSSFSWWGAWLNKYDNKIVICPSKFSNNDINTDVYPNSWLKI
jgi:hypothetical protein